MGLRQCAKLEFWLRVVNVIVVIVTLTKEETRSVVWFSPFTNLFMFICKLFNCCHLEEENVYEPFEKNCFLTQI